MSVSWDSRDLGMGVTAFGLREPDPQCQDNPDEHDQLEQDLEDDLWDMLRRQGP